jgi:hypothetical protein
MAVGRTVADHPAARTVLALISEDENVKARLSRAFSSAFSTLFGNAGARLRFRQAASKQLSG